VTCCMTLGQCIYKILWKTRFLIQYLHRNNKINVQCNAHRNTQRRVNKFVLGFWGGTCNICIKFNNMLWMKGQCCNTALKPQNIIWICGWVMQYLHQKGNTSWFLDGSCNICIEVEKYLLDLWVGHIVPASKRKYGLVLRWFILY
jgi:hypothetical protein